MIQALRLTLHFPPRSFDRGTRDSRAMKFRQRGMQIVNGTIKEISLAGRGDRNRFASTQWQRAFVRHSNFIRSTPSPLNILSSSLNYVYTIAGSLDR